MIHFTLKKILIVKNVSLHISTYQKTHMIYTLLILKIER